MSELLDASESDLWKTLADYGRRYDRAVGGGARHLRMVFVLSIVQVWWETGPDDAASQHALWRGVEDAIGLLTERLKAIVIASEKKVARDMERKAR